MENNQSPALTLDSADLSLSAYRALREGRDAPKESAPVTEDKTPAADAVAESAADADADAANNSETGTHEDDSKESKAPKKDKLNARFSELTGKIKDLERQLSDAQRNAPNGPNGGGEKPADAPQLPPDPKDPEPTADKFTDYVEWQKSWMKWQIRQEKRQEQAARSAAEKQSAAKAKADTWQGRVTEAKSEFSDFDSVAMNKDLTVTNVMAEAITDSDLGPKILYELGKNPAEASRISKLSPAAQAREIGKLEARLEAAAEKSSGESSETPQTKKPAVSKAPPPVKPLGSSSASSNPAKAVETMSLSEYRALRESGKLR